MRLTIQDFTAREVVPIARESDKSGELPWDCVKKLAAPGLFGILLPTSYGGTRRRIFKKSCQPVLDGELSVQGWKTFGERFYISHHLIHHIVTHGF